MVGPVKQEMGKGYWLEEFKFGDANYYACCDWHQANKAAFDAWAVSKAKQAGFEFSPYEIGVVNAEEEDEAEFPVTAMDNDMPEPEANVKEENEEENEDLTCDDQLDDLESVGALAFSAECGNLRAQCELGIKYMEGDGIEKDVEAGLNWLREAAAYGYTEAQYQLGRYLLLQWDSSEDASDEIRKEGEGWLRQAADGGYSIAEEFLGAL